MFANGLASFFYILFPLLYDIRLTGLSSYSASPPTLITINHKRDLDMTPKMMFIELFSLLFDCLFSHSVSHMVGPHHSTRPYRIRGNKA